MTKTLTCIICPLGCPVTVDGESVEGHTCPRGKDWALQEFNNPLRMLTTTIALEGGVLELLPVRTQVAVPKQKLMECMKHANRLRVKAPVQVGQIICSDLAETGVRLIAARSMAER